MKFPVPNVGIFAAVLAISGCQLGTAVIEGVQGPEAVAAAHQLTLERHMMSDCRTLILQEQGLRRVVNNPLTNIAGGATSARDYKAIVEAIERKRCVS